jgi:hypothetical protein
VAVVVDEAGGERPCRWTLAGCSRTDRGYPSMFYSYADASTGPVSIDDEVRE